MAANLDLSAPPAVDLDAIRNLGKYGDIPVSDLFLTIQYHVHKGLETDPEANVLPPQASHAVTGWIPLSIVSTVHDIMTHYAKMIPEAQEEILLGTNFWRAGESVKLLSGALQALSNKIGASGSKRVNVKILFDRGVLSINPRQKISERDFSSAAIGLPPAADVPNLNIEVINYHNFPLGTFHPKFLIIDQKVAIVNSCNIQDNTNLELMIHMQGDIVPSVREFALLSWFGNAETLSPSQSVIEHDESVQSDIMNINQETKLANAPFEIPSTEAEATEYIEAITRRLNNTYRITTKGNLPPDQADAERRPFIPYLEHDNPHVPIAMVNRKPSALPGNTSLVVPQNIAWLSAFQNAKEEIYIQTPDLNAEPAVEAVLNAVIRGVKVEICLCLGYNDFGEMIPMQGGANDYIIRRLYSTLPKDKHYLLKIWWYTARDMIGPINALEAIRTCHIKLLIADSHLAILGSGNQDTQSWFHSQEINVMIDSKEFCTDLRRQLRCNQNSEQYGAVLNEDGSYRAVTGRYMAFGRRVGRFLGLWT